MCMKEPLRSIRHMARRRRPTTPIISISGVAPPAGLLRRQQLHWPMADKWATTFHTQRRCCITRRLWHRRRRGWLPLGSISEPGHCPSLQLLHKLQVRVRYWSSVHVFFVTHAQRLNLIYSLKLGITMALATPTTLPPSPTGYPYRLVPAHFSASTAPQQPLA